MSTLESLIETIVNREAPDSGQSVSNSEMFKEILRYMDLDEINILENLNYEFLYENCISEEFDQINQRVAYLQMVCFREIPDYMDDHGIHSIEVKEANAELWFKRFSARIDPDRKLYLH